MSTRQRARAIGLGLLASLVVPAQAQTCSALSGALRTPVIELYTSEGCSSCPSADHWLAQFKARPKLVALAFHVDYWDRLGWVDRFASPLYTQRQVMQLAVNGARFSYTPQVVIDGADRKDWYRLGDTLGTPREPAPAQIRLARDGQQFSAVVSSQTKLRLAAYWAVSEDGFSTSVQAGENAGVSLHHEHVVRELQSVPAWANEAGAPTTLRFSPRSAPDPAHPRQVSLVLLDAETGRPVQALSLGC